MGHFLCDILQRRRRIRYFAALFESAPPPPLRLCYYEQQGDKGFCPKYPQTPARPAFFSHINRHALGSVGKAAASFLFFSFFAPAIVLKETL
jgi:hypothetical protein